MRRCSACSSISTSVIARPSSVALTAHLRVIDDPRDRDDVLAAHDQWPCLAVGAWDLGVDEHVLDLLRPAGEPVAGPPSSHFEPRRVRGDAPGPPFDRPVEVDGPML